MDNGINLLTVTLLLCVIFMGVGSIAKAQQIQTKALKAEYFSNPLGIGDPHPRLSWKINSPRRNTVQAAYHIQVAESKEALQKGDATWDTGKINSDQSIQVAYDGPALISGTRYYWRVRVWDDKGNASAWSAPAYWEMGLLSAADWQARWIKPGLDQDTTTSQPSPMLRREFKLNGNGEIASARAYVTGLGLYEMKINGSRVGDELLTPGWTSYHKRLQYQTYDITDLLQSGENAVGVTLGDGWYRGWIGFNDQRNLYGSKLALLAQIEVTYANGKTEIIGTDESWKVSTGAILKSDIYNGETYDARLEKEGWTEPGFDDKTWSKVNLANHNKNILVAPDGPPVRKIQELKPVEIIYTPEGDTVVDMGQNMVGWARLTVQGPAGTEVTLHHAEVLDKKGNFYTENLRAAAQKDTYVLKGEGEEVYEPHFTFHGFRYVKIENYPGDLTTGDVTGVVIHSDMNPTGHFESSNPLVNQLQHNIVWGQKGNFVDVPTDCPQRDERLGWTGDIEVFAQTACFNMNAAGFLTKWLEDLEADQLDNGSVPFVIPNVLGKEAAGASGWADASVIVPWTVYQAYGDERILESQYESMKGWVEYMRTRAQKDSTAYLWDNNFTFGDWLSFNSTASDYPGAYTDKKLISTAYFARSTDLLQRSAEILGNEKDAREYAKLLTNIKQAFQREYLTASGRIMSNTQTAYLLALQFNLLPGDMVQEATHYLVARINERGHLTTGFLGTPHLNPVLSHFGQSGQAYELLLRKEYPSWLYPVTRGATTIWERWDGIKPDSTFQDAGMNSFNHYAYGAIGEWLYRNVAGLSAETPGYKKILIRPDPGGGLSHARALIQSMYGKAESSWEISGDTFTLDIEVPVNTTAKVVLPHAVAKNVREGGKPLSGVNEITNVAQTDGAVTLEVGSGRYSFSYSAGEMAMAGKKKEKEIEEEKNKDNAEASVDIDEPLGYLIANKKARAILHKHLPELMNSPWLSQVMGFPLERAMNAVPDEYRISGETMGAISRELKALN